MKILKIFIVLPLVFNFTVVGCATIKPTFIILLMDDVSCDFLSSILKEHVRGPCWCCVSTSKLTGSLGAMLVYKLTWSLGAIRNSSRAMLKGKTKGTAKYSVYTAGSMHERSAACKSVRGTVSTLVA